MKKIIPIILILVVIVGIGLLLLQSKLFQPAPGQPEQPTKTEVQEKPKGPYSVIFLRIQENVPEEIKNHLPYGKPLYAIHSVKEDGSGELTIDDQVWIEEKGDPQVVSSLTGRKIAYVRVEGEKAVLYINDFNGKNKIKVDEIEMKIVRLRSTEPGFYTNPPEIYPLAWFKDEKLLYAKKICKDEYSCKMDIHLYDGSKTTSLLTLSDFSPDIYLSSDGERFLYLTWPGIYQIFQIKDGRCEKIGEYDPRKTLFQYGVSFAPNLRVGLLVSPFGGGDMVSEVHIYDIDKAATVPVNIGKLVNPVSIIWAPDSKAVMMIGYKDYYPPAQEKKAYVIDVESGKATELSSYDKAIEFIMDNKWRPRIILEKNWNEIFKVMDPSRPLDINIEHVQAFSGRSLSLERDKFACVIQSPLGDLDLYLFDVRTKNQKLLARNVVPIAPIIVNPGP